MQEGYRRLTDQAPGTLHAVDNLFTDNSDTMVQLLGNLTTTSQLLYLRVPALNALFPDYRGSVLDALRQHHARQRPLGHRRHLSRATPATTERRAAPPSSADYPEPFMYTYCRDDHPGVLVRGAKNAPRRRATTPQARRPGPTSAATTDPTPKGRFTIPTPYGGPGAAHRSRPDSPTREVRS